MSLSKENLNVLTNIIGAVESGGQVYGKRNYSAYADPGQNTSGEKTITLGWAQYYGDEAYTLLSRIYKADPATFVLFDSDGSILKKIRAGNNWVATRWNPTALQKSNIIKIINMQKGREVQDAMFIELMEGFIADCEKDYSSDVKALMMYCEIRHLGGKKAVDRVFKKCKGYSIDTIMTALRKDQTDRSSDNQVGDNLYWSRHEKCYEFINKYAVTDSTPAKTEEKVESMTVTDYLINKYKIAVYSGKTTISNSGHDERGRYKYGTAGDQTGTEWEIKAWYNRPWNYVFRPKSAKVAALLAEYGVQAAQNDNIGYDQEERWTYNDALLQTSTLQPISVKVKCEADCSAGVAANLRAIGRKLGISSFEIFKADTYSGNIRSRINSTGEFTVLSSSKYTANSDYLLPGDILLYENHHVATNVTVGSKAVDYEVDGETLTVIETTPVTKSENVKTVSANASALVKAGQIHSNNFTGHTIETDGIVGKETRKQKVRVLQRALNEQYKAELEEDGICGTLTKNALGKHSVKKGDYNYMVTACEILLFMNNYNPGGVECPGRYSNLTDGIVRTYQIAHRLSVDGICGRETFLSLIQ